MVEGRGDKMSKDTKSNKELEVEIEKAKTEVLVEKIKRLEAITKGSDKEVEFQERIALYESKKPERDALKAKIQQRVYELQMEAMNAGLSYTLQDCIQLESFERLSKEAKQRDDQDAYIKFTWAYNKLKKELAK